MKLSDLIEHGIIWKESPSKWQALKELTALLFEKGAITNYDEFSRALIEREKIVSTGIGIGVAIPHARLESLEKFVLAIGIAQDHGIEWDSIDKQPVQLIFAIGAPAHAQQEYLRLLASITSFIENPSVRKKLVKVKSVEQLIDLFRKRK